MSPLTVHVKHGGKTHDVQLDPDRPASVFKEAVYQVTGVPLERMKVMIKGGILKVGIPGANQPGSYLMLGFVIGFDFAPDG